MKDTIKHLYPNIKGRNVNQLKDVYGSFVKQNCKDLRTKLLGNIVPKFIDAGINTIMGMGGLLYENKDKLH